MELEKSILKTLVYYDCLDYPLTKEELEIFSFKNDISEEISYLIQEAEDFYFLKGRNDLIEIRKERNEIAKKKWQRTLKAVKWLQLIPYVRLVFASGSLALFNTDKESDLDILIITKFGRIWTARFLTVILLSLLGVRRTRYQKIAPDKVCLNHFITDQSLHIPRKSIYTIHLYAHLIPTLINQKNLLEEFKKANSWIGEYINWSECLKIRPELMVKKSFLVDSIRKFGETILNTKIGDWVENILKKYQLRRIKNFPLTYKPGGRVKADDESLEFHPDSPEFKIIEKYNKKMIELGFKDLTEKTSFL